MKQIYRQYTASIKENRQDTGDNDSVYQVWSVR